MTLFHLERMRATSCGWGTRSFEVFECASWWYSKACGRVEHAIPGASNLETQIDVVECDREIVLVESLHLPEDVSLGHQAGTCDSTDVADDVRKVEVVCVLPSSDLKAWPQLSNIPITTPACWISPLG